MEVHMPAWSIVITAISCTVAIAAFLFKIMRLIAEVSHYLGRLDSLRDNVNQLHDNVNQLRTDFNQHRIENREDFKAINDKLDQILLSSTNKE
jgi:uncharacterized protein YlxW (UPF0749 family)